MVAAVRKIHDEVCRNRSNMCSLAYCDTYLGIYLAYRAAVADAANVARRAYMVSDPSAVYRAIEALAPKEEL